MQFETRKLADLHPAEYNPRKKLTPSDPEYVQIKNSTNEFGYADPIVINADGTIIKGHQRCNGRGGVRGAVDDQGGPAGQGGGGVHLIGQAVTSGGVDR